MMHTIYADRADEVRKALDRLVKKAARYSVPFSYSIGEPHPYTVPVYNIDPVTQTKYRDGAYTVSAVDVTVECDGLIRADGWTLRARIEHGDCGNIVTQLGEKPTNPAWFTAPARCDHCGTNRARSVTYIVESKRGELRQVGKSCLREYTGIDPETAAAWASIREILLEDDWGGLDLDELTQRYKPMYLVDEVIAHAVDSVKAKGYIKSDMPHSTKEDVFDRLHERIAPSKLAKKRAGEIVDWLRDLDPRSDLLMNCQNLVKQEYVKASHIGYLAYLPVAFDRERAKADERAARAEAGAKSKYIGNVGERITFRAANAVLVTSWETQYGWTYLYKFSDDSGNILIWYASRTVDVADGAKITGTIKAHNERDGAKQTVITRCKVA